MPWRWPFRARPVVRTPEARRAEAVTGELDRALAQVKQSVEKMQDIAATAAQIVERHNGGGQPE